jgi:hypothetical protein
MRRRRWFIEKRQGRAVRRTTRQKYFKKKGHYKNATIKIALVILPLIITLGVAYHWQMKTNRRIDQISPPLPDYEEKVKDKLIKDFPLGYVLLWYNKKGGTSTTLVKTDKSFNRSE